MTGAGLMADDFLIEDESEIHHPGRRAPIPAGSDARMVQYLTRLRDRTVAALGEIDETLETYRMMLDCYQPKSNEKIGLVWLRRKGRYNEALQPRMVRWLIRHFSGGIRWFYTPLPLKDLPRKAKSRGGWGLGHADTRDSLVRIQELIEKRERLLILWTNIARSLGKIEPILAELPQERAELIRRIPKGPFYEQAKKYSKGLP